MISHWLLPRRTSAERLLSGSNKNLTKDVVRLDLDKRGLGAGQQKGVDVNYPPYPIHNGMLAATYDQYRGH